MYKRLLYSSIYINFNILLLYYARNERKKRLEK